MSELYKYELTIVVFVNSEVYACFNSVVGTPITITVSHVIKSFQSYHKSGLDFIWWFFDTVDDIMFAL